MPKLFAELLGWLLFAFADLPPIDRDEDIFPDSMSQSLAEAWRTGAVKALERQFAGIGPARRNELCL
jgi:hypothetical protein